MTVPSITLLAFNAPFAKIYQYQCKSYERKIPMLLSKFGAFFRFRFARIAVIIIYLKYGRCGRRQYIMKPAKGEGRRRKKLFVEEKKLYNFNR